MDVNYVVPTGPQTCEVVFNWFMDSNVYEGMTEEARETIITDAIRDRYS